MFNAVDKITHLTNRKEYKRLRQNLIELMQIIASDDWTSDSLTHLHLSDEFELDKIINSCYTANDNSGYNYGCNDNIKNSLCQSTCFLYKSKKNQSIMSSTDMENVLIDFYTSNIKPIDFKDL